MKFSRSLLGLGVLLGACDADDVKDAYYGRLIYDVLPETARGFSYDPEGDPESVYRQFNLSAAFVDDQVVEFLDLGPVNPYVPKVYVMVRGGQPVDGQYPIIDTLPDQVEYSSFWQVVEVSVPSSYQANDIKSLAGIQKAGFNRKAKVEAWYCPVVNPDADWVAADGVTYLTDPIYLDPNPDTLCDDALLPPALNVFYGTGEPIPNQDPAFVPSEDGTPGPIPPTLTDADATEADIRLQPVWHKRLLGFCWPGMTDAARAKRYPLVFEDGVAMLDSRAFSGRYDFYTDDLTLAAELPTLLEAGPIEGDYTPALNAYAVPADGLDPENLPTGLEGLDVSMAENTGLVDNPIVRVVPAPAPACTDAE